MPPKKKTTAKNQFRYGRDVTIQVQQFNPETVSFEDYIESDEPITDEEKQSVIRNIDSLISEGRKKLITIRDNGGVEPEKTESNEKAPQLSDKKIYIPKKCKDLSMKFSRGQFMVSVTSIFSYLNPIDFPQDLLEIYGERGTLVHDTLEHNILNKALLKPSEFDPERHKEILAKEVSGIINGHKWSKFLNADDCDVVGFLNEHGKDFEFQDLEKDVSNYDYGFYGRYDFNGKYKGLKSIGDFKSTEPKKDKVEKAFKQMAAYSLCEDGIEQLVGVFLNPKTKKVVIKTTNEVKKYQEIFLADLEKFKKEVEIVYV